MDNLRPSPIPHMVPTRPRGEKTSASLDTAAPLAEAEFMYHQDPNKHRVCLHCGLARDRHTFLSGQLHCKNSPAVRHAQAVHLADLIDSGASLTLVYELARRGYSKGGGFDLVAARLTTVFLILSRRYSHSPGRMLTVNARLQELVTFLESEA